MITVIIVVIILLLCCLFVSTTTTASGRRGGVDIQLFCRRGFVVGMDATVVNAVVVVVVVNVAGPVLAEHKPRPPSFWFLLWWLFACRSFTGRGGGGGCGNGCCCLFRERHRNEGNKKIEVVVLAVVVMMVVVWCGSLSFSTLSSHASAAAREDSCCSILLLIGWIDGWLVGNTLSRSLFGKTTRRSKEYLYLYSYLLFHTTAKKGRKKNRTGQHYSVDVGELTSCLTACYSILTDRPKGSTMVVRSPSKCRPRSRDTRDSVQNPHAVSELLVPT